MNQMKEATFSERSVFAFLVSLALTVREIPEPSRQEGDRGEFLTHLSSRMDYYLGQEHPAIELLSRHERGQLLYLKMILHYLVNQKIRDQS